MRVIVTRPLNEAGKWVEDLARVGVDAIALPLIGVGPDADPQSVAAAWGRMESYHAVMFVSGNAVNYFFALKPASIRVFTAEAAIKTRAFVTGPGSFSALIGNGAEASCIDSPDLDAGQFDSEALWSLVKNQVQPGVRILIVRGAVGYARGDELGQGRDWFANQVLAAGAQVDFVVAYRRLVPEFAAPDFALIREAAVDGSVWLFSSSEAIANLVMACPGQSWKQARAIVTHGRIAQAAYDAGFAVVCESRPVLASMVASIESLR